MKKSWKFNGKARSSRRAAIAGTCTRVSASATAHKYGPLIGASDFFVDEALVGQFASTRRAARPPAVAADPTGRKGSNRKHEPRHEAQEQSRIDGCDVARCAGVCDRVLSRPVKEVIVRISHGRSSSSLACEMDGLRLGALVDDPRSSVQQRGQDDLRAAFERRAECRCGTRRRPPYPARSGRDGGTPQRVRRSSRRSGSTRTRRNGGRGVVPPGSGSRGRRALRATGSR